MEYEDNEEIDTDFIISLTTAIDLFFIENPKGSITKKDYELTKREILKFDKVNKKLEPVSYIG